MSITTHEEIQKNLKVKASGNVFAKRNDIEFLNSRFIYFADASHTHHILGLKSDSATHVAFSVPKTLAEGESHHIDYEVVQSLPEYMSWSINDGSKHFQVEKGSVTITLFEGKAHAVGTFDFTLKNGGGVATGTFDVRK